MQKEQYTSIAGDMMNRTSHTPVLKEELMLQINERLFQLGLLTKELYEQAKLQIVSRRT